MDMVNVVLIGVGGIGFRHFQSILEEKKHAINMLLVDVDENALLKAREYEKGAHNSRVNVEYAENIERARGKIDVVIVATSSLVRREMFEQAVKRCIIRFVIFEKFLFPSINDYEKVGNLLKSNGIKAYVNCPSRLYPGYIDLKKELRSTQHLDVIVSGSNWGLACNVIHTIDVVGFLLDTYDELKVDGALLDNEILDSKRKNYIEFTGRLVCKLGDKANIVLDSTKSGEVPFNLTIFGRDEIYNIWETRQKVSIFSDDRLKEKNFPILYQSQLTEKIIDDLAENNKCNLTTYESTVQWHIALLEAFLDKYKRIKGCDSEICPIT